MKKRSASKANSLFDAIRDYEQKNARAVKKALAAQTRQRIEELGLNMTTFSARMGTSRNQAYRVLDPEDSGITLKMLFRLSYALDMPLRVTLEKGSGGGAKAKKAPAPAKAAAKASGRGKRR